MVQGVLFDFFGTLVNYNSDRTSQTYHKSFEILVSLGVDENYQSFLDRVDKLFGRFMDESFSRQTEFSMQQVLQRLMDEYELAVTRAQVDQLAESYTLEWAHSVVPVKGIKRFLSNLGREFRLGLITNTHYAPMIHRLIREMEIGDLFDLVLTSVEYGKPKPHADIFYDALAKLDITPADAVYVGDSYQADYQGATGVGMDCYLIGKHARVPMEFQISTVLDLPLYRLK
jgi:HAD superfamily hydrolase (TIGR01509 family)